MAMSWSLRSDEVKSSSYLIFILHFPMLQSVFVELVYIFTPVKDTLNELVELR